MHARQRESGIASKNDSQDSRRNEVPSMTRHEDDKASRAMVHSGHNKRLPREAWPPQLRQPYLNLNLCLVLNN